MDYEMPSKKLKGKEWVEAILPTLVEISRKIKEIVTKKEEECKPITFLLTQIVNSYKEQLADLEETNNKIREEILKQYERTEAIKQAGIGTILFAERVSWDITDLSKVDRKYLTIDSKAVSEAIKNGVATIKGLQIGKKRIVQVRTDG